MKASTGVKTGRVVTNIDLLRLFKALLCWWYEEPNLKKRSKEDLPTNDEKSNEQCAACLQITETLFMSGGEMASCSPAHRHNSTECRCWYYLALLHIFLRYTLQFTSQLVHYITSKKTRGWVKKVEEWMCKVQAGHCELLFWIELTSCASGGR